MNILTYVEDVGWTCSLDVALSASVRDGQPHGSRAFSNWSKDFAGTRVHESEVGGTATGTGPLGGGSRILTCAPRISSNPSVQVVPEGDKNACSAVTAKGVWGRAKQKNKTTVRVRTILKTTKVMLKGAGIESTKKVNSKGVAVFGVRPKKAGRIRVTTTGCSAISVKALGAKRVVNRTAPTNAGSKLHQNSTRVASLLAIIATASTAGALLGAGPAAAGPIKYKQISTPGEYSQWAYVEVATYAYSRPSKYSRKVTKVSTRTSDRTDNVVYIEGSSVNGGLWYKVLLPSVHGTSAWVPASRLGAPQAVSTHIVIDLAARSLTLIKGGRTVLTAVVGIGKAGTPTPPGDFYIRSKMHGFNNPAYGVRAMGTSAKSKVLTDWPGGGFVGIHGTNQPDILPGRVSHGCVRVRNRTIVRIYNLVSVGTPVTIK